jgi:PAS domain S-box-containing protein
MSETNKIEQNILRTVIDEMTDILVLKDEYGKFKLCNRTVAQLYGTTPDEMVGKEDGDFGVPPELNDFFKQNVLGIMARGETEIVYEKSRDSKTGEIRHFKSTKKPFKDAQGKNQILVIAHDMTEEIRAQERIEESEKRLHYVLKAAQEAIWDWDIRTGDIYHNDGWFTNLGYERGELESNINGYSQLIHADDGPHVMKQINEHLESKTERYLAEYRMRCKNGTYLWVYDRGQIVERDEKGQATRMVGSFTNIDERKKAEEMMLQAKQMAEIANRTKSEFLANMSHEIRTPMNGVIGMTSLLLTTQLSVEQRKYLETIRSSGEALLTVINDILDFSKVEAGRLSLEQLSFNLREVALSTVDLLRLNAEEKNLKLNIDITNDTPQWVIGDPGRWRQVLTNLIGNAIKFTHQGSVQIKISSIIENQKAIIKSEVIDTGIGVPVEKLNKLFKPFSQVDASTTRMFGGTGLGLLISKRLSELMGGQIGVDSETRVGSCFWFTVIFSVIENHKAEAAQPNSVVTLLNKNNQKRILLVEDNMTNQKVAMAMLKKLGHFVDAVANGEEAIHQLSLLSYDLILMDCQMPVKDGFTTTREIRAGAVQGREKTTIIALTANAMAEDKNACLQSGMDDFMSKPINMNDLVTCLDKYFKN